jgi:hypothetical protein
LTDVVCQACQAKVAGYDAVRYGSEETGHRDLCSCCFNEEVARERGLDFEHVSFQPVELIDAAGVEHRFHVKLRLLGDRVALDAFELIGGAPGGYQFQTIDDATTDLFGLLGRLIRRMRQALAVQHLRVSGENLSIADLLVRGRVEYDSETDGRTPMLVIDGREVSWEQFGRLLMMFEGWQFKLEIRDLSEDV